VPTSSSCLDLSNYTWRRVQTMQLLTNVSSEPALQTSSVPRIKSQTQSFQPHYGPVVDSASDRNEDQESSWG
jgi:hypothetical protein